VQYLSSSPAWLLAALTALATPGFAAELAAPAPAPVAAPSAPAPAAAPAMRRCTAIIPDDQPTYAVLGKSVVIPLKARGSVAAH
jgi:pilus assembly protein CpaC